MHLVVILRSYYLADALFKNVKYIGNYVKLIIAVYNNHIITTYAYKTSFNIGYKPPKPQSNKD